jgi:cytochrome P450
MTAEALPPGPGPIPLNMLGWTLRPVPFMERCRRRYGERFTVDLGPPEGKWIFLTQPDEIREMFSAPADVLHPGEGARVLEPVVGPRSVLLLDGAEHLAQRKLMLPAFHGERMRSLTGAMEEVAAREVAAWRPGEPFTLHTRTQALTLEIILRAVFGMAAGARLDALRSTLKELLDLGASPLTLLPPFRRRLGPLTTWARFVDVRDHADALILEQIETRRRAGDEGDDVLTMLLAARDEDGNPMSDRELRDELLTLVTAGHETTATALSWGFERLVRNPPVLNRLVDEVRTGESDEYLDATIKETLRSRAVVTDIARRLTGDADVCGYRIPKGTLVLAAIAALHHRPDLYPEPEAFRPERFLEEQSEHYGWIPFGGGVRRCIGASFAQFEMKVVLRTILSGARLRAAEPAPERGRIRHVTVVPARGTRVVLEKRLGAVRGGRAEAVPA